MTSGPDGAGGTDRGVLGTGLSAALGDLAARERLLVAMDFDGTLAPFAADPAQARALPGAAAALAELAGRPGVVVALVSGRAVQSLREVADPPPGATLVGSHGAEVVRAGADGGVAEDGTNLLDAAARGRLEQVVEELGAVVAAHEGTGLERKTAGVVLHTRRAERDVAEAATAAALTGPATLEGVHALRGKEVVELSVVDTDKGRALVALRDELGVDGVLFAGDDTTDEHGFEALAAWPGDVTVKVGAGETAARWRVEDPPAVAALLQQLLALRG